MASGKKNYFRHYLYVIGEDADETVGVYSGFIKIGITNNPKNRFKALQSSSPRKLKVILVLGYFSKIEAEIAELGIHKKLEFHRASGEWFMFNFYTDRTISKFKELLHINITKDWSNE